MFFSCLLVPDITALLFELERLQSDLYSLYLENSINTVLAVEEIYGTHQVQLKSISGDISVYRIK